MTAPLLSADTCPSCTQVHGQPTDWPTCPEHGHWMHVVSAGAHGFTYACPAWRCTHTHTQSRKATMPDTATAALAIRDGQDFWTPKQAAALAQLFNETPPNADLAVFLHRCQATGLDPFANQITMIKRGGQWKIQTEIDGFRVIRDRAAKRDGVTVSYGRTKWCDHNRQWFEEWIDDDLPAACEMTVYVDGRPFPAQIRFNAFAVRNKGGELTAQWRSMGDHLIAKCAEAQALRKAFPQDLEGVAIAEETGRPMAAPPRAPIVTQLAPTASAPEHDAEPEPITAQTLRDAVDGEFARLGITDDEERAVYGYQLAGKPHGTELGPDDLNRVLSALVDCETIEHIREITGQDTLL